MIYYAARPQKKRIEASKLVNRYRPIEARDGRLIEQRTSFFSFDLIDDWRDHQN